MNNHLKTLGQQMRNGVGTTSVPNASDGVVLDQAIAQYKRTHPADSGNHFYESGSRFFEGPDHTGVQDESRG